MPGEKGNKITQKAKSKKQNAKPQNFIPIPPLAFAVLIIDQLTKLSATHFLQMGESKNLIPRVLRLTLVHNTGTAFGLLKGHTDIFTLISIAVIFSITLYLSSRRRYLSSSISISLALILGGAAGNLIDRIRFGYVIDFLDIIVWPVFNIADMAITAAAAILIADVLITRRRA